MYIFSRVFTPFKFFFILIVTYNKEKINRNKQKELDEDRKEIEKLEEQIAVQEKRTLDLDALKVYVTTMKYVEEKAKKLGLVYPDEIVFKPR